MIIEFVKYAAHDHQHRDDEILELKHQHRNHNHQHHHHRNMMMNKATVRLAVAGVLFQHATQCRQSSTTTSTTTRATTTSLWRILLLRLSSARLRAPRPLLARLRAPRRNDLRNISYATDMTYDHAINADLCSRTVTRTMTLGDLPTSRRQYDYSTIRSSQ